MLSQTDQQRLQRLLDQAEIYDCLCRYARGVDRGDWALVRSTYHPDAQDQHGEYAGGVDGLIDWLEQRFAGIDNGMHFLGNCAVEFVDADRALVETYFISHRLAPRAGREDQSEAVCRQAWGRYIDRFERRDGAWRVADRIVVLDASFQAPVKSAPRLPPSTWGRRDRQDPYFIAAGAKR